MLDHVGLEVADLDRSGLSDGLAPSLNMMRAACVQLSS